MKIKIEDIVDLYNSKNFQRALNSVNKYIKINENNNQAYNLKGVILRALGRNNEALLNQDKAIKIKPNDLNAYNNKANILRQLKRYKEAEKLYKKHFKQIIVIFLDFLTYLNFTMKLEITMNQKIMP